MFPDMLAPMNTQYVLDVPLTLAEASYGYRGGALPPGFGNPSLITVGDSSDPLVRHIAAVDPVFGFSCEDEQGNLHIAYHGTEKLSEWLNDFDATLEKSGDGSVFRGFAELFRATIPTLAGRRRNQKITCTGHSLGGPLSTHAALHLGADELYTFESPRTGDQKFADQCNASRTAHYRFFNVRDKIADEPLRPIGAHCGGAIKLDGWTVATSLEEKLDARWQHRIETAVRPCIRRLPAFVTPEFPSY